MCVKLKGYPICSHAAATETQPPTVGKRARAPLQQSSRRQPVQGACVLASVCERRLRRLRLALGAAAAEDEDEEDDEDDDDE